jgi:hypothetical protein
MFFPSEERDLQVVSAERDEGKHGEKYDLAAVVDGSKDVRDQHGEFRSSVVFLYGCDPQPTSNKFKFF